MKLPPFFKKLLAFVHAMPVIGGLEVSDSVLRLTLFENNAWHAVSVRLPFGVIEGGIIKDREQFVAAAKDLRAQIAGGKKHNQKMSAILSLSSVSIYSQVFSLPMIEGEDLEKAAELNIRMVSPIEASKAYWGWHRVGSDENSLRFEILGVFISRELVEGLHQALSDGGFVLIAAESKALSLVRLMREAGAGFDRAHPSILVSIDSSGLDIMIIRNGNLYFDYFAAWRDVQDDKGEVTLPALQTLVAKNMHQVVNFYGQHWPEPLGDIYISATGLEEEIENIIKQNFPFTAKKIVLTTPGTFTPDWFVALGAGIRGLVPRREDSELSLLGIDTEEEYRREEILGFLRFWRVLVPVAASVLIFVALGSDLYIRTTLRKLSAQTAFTISPDRQKELNALQDQARTFNKEVAFIAGIEQNAKPKSAVIDEITGLLAKNNVMLDRVSFAGYGAPLTLSGHALSEDNILAMKKAFDANPKFQNVSLPLVNIKSSGDGFTFSLTFGVVP